MKAQNFNDVVYGLVKRVPSGKVTTYGNLARLIGNPRLSRQVGWVLHANRDSKTPCHRVVDRNGRLAPNFAGPQAPRAQAIGRRAFLAKGQPAFGWDGAGEQKKRLVAEGVKFKDNMHVNLEECLWD